MGIPLISQATMQSIIEEVCVKNEDFGVEEFSSNLETKNEPVAVVLYAFIDAISDYMSNGDQEKKEEFCALAKMSTNLLYKTIEKQIEINEMTHE